MDTQLHIPINAKANYSHYSNTYKHSFIDVNVYNAYEYL